MPINKLTGNFSGRVEPANPQLRSAGTLGATHGINSDYDDILGKLRQGTVDEFNVRRKETLNNENKFYDRLSGTQYASMDAINKLKGSIVTGAGKGATNANVASALLGLQQTSTDDSTMLAQEYQGLIDKEASAYSKNVVDALNTSNDLKMKLGQMGNELYGYDVQNRSADLSYLAELENAIAQLEGTQYNADKNLEGTQYNADKNLEGTVYNADTNYKGTVYNANSNRSNVLDQLAQSKAQFDSTNASKGSLQTALAEARKNKDFNSFMDIMIELGVTDPDQIKNLYSGYYTPNYPQTATRPNSTGTELLRPLGPATWYPSDSGTTSKTTTKKESAYKDKK